MKMQKLLLLGLLTIGLCNTPLKSSNLIIKNATTYAVTVTVSYTHKAKATSSIVTPIGTMSITNPYCGQIDLGNVARIKEVTIMGTGILSLTSRKHYVNIQDAQKLAQSDNDKDIAAIIDLTPFMAFTIRPLQLQDPEDSGATVPAAVQQVQPDNQAHTIAEATICDKNNTLAQQESHSNSNSSSAPAAAQAPAAQQTERIPYGKAESIGRRPTMEDADIIEPALTAQSSLFAILDGHNGAEVAEYVAFYLPGYLKETLKSHDPKKALEEALKATTTSLENSLLAGPAQSMGTTAICTLIINGVLYVANIGDSRAILCSKGKAIALSRDQKPERLDEALRIKKAGGTIIKMGLDDKKNTVLLPEHLWHTSSAPLRIMAPECRTLLSMTRAIGDFGLRPAGLIATPEIIDCRLTRSDEFLLLACDGIFEKNINRQRAVDIVRQALIRYQEYPDVAQRAAKELVDAAYKSGSEDNLSALVVLLKK